MNKRTTFSIFPLLISFVAMILFTSSDCGNTPPPVDGYQYEAATVIEMSKTPCFGTCPEFDMTINGKGAATYLGKRFVTKEGQHEKLFDADSTNALIKAFIDANFWSFDDEYTDNITDLPTTFLTFKHGGKEKKIRMYANVPEKLRELEAKVDQLADSEGWKKMGN